MQAPAVPLDEDRRLESVSALGLLDTPAEERFDRVTRLAQRVFAVPAATISIVDRTRAWFKATTGLPLTQVARPISFCGHTVAAGEMMIVSDTRSDARFADNPMVIHEPKVRFYAGYPLTSADGSVIGALSIYDAQPRELPADDRQVLRDLALIVETELRATPLTPAQLDLATERRGTGDSSRVDPLTRLWNRSAALQILDRELEHAQREQTSIAVLLIDVDQMRAVNEREGHSAGDALLSEIARVLRNSLRPYDTIARWGGEEFFALLPGVDHEHAALAAERLRISLRRDWRLATRSVTLSVGGATTPPQTREKEALLRAAETALWQAKKQGGDASQIAVRIP